jgi:LPPG:FO 2-phospho-L-lactate transferase
VSPTPDAARGPDGRPPANGPVVALAGGVGGAKLAAGLQAHLGERLVVVVNTGDDLEVHGLAVWPDIDTVTYTLAGLDDRERGWGLADERWTVMDALERLGGDAWFRLGDRDLATHLFRTGRLREGARPTEIALEVGRALGARARVLPMCDRPVRTEVRTDDGWLEFQEYFVHRRQTPEVRAVRFLGLEMAAPTPEVAGALGEASVVVVAPSNPIVSIGPILAVPGMAAALAGARARGVPIVAISPIVGGRALKGPADRMLASLGHDASALGVARLYRDLATGFVLDEIDRAMAPDVEALGLAVHVTDTIMVDDAARARLAAEVLAFAGRVAARAGAGATPVDPGADPGSTAAASAPAAVAVPSVGRLIAVVPIRALEGAKSRLGEALDAEERRDLVTALLLRTVRAALATPGVTEVIVVSADPAALRLAGEAGASTVLQREGELNEGLEAARREALARGATALVVLPADLAWVDPEAVRTLLVEAGDGPVVGLAPDRLGRGTNALYLAPPDVVPFAFGPESRAAHHRLAMAADARYVEVEGPLALDVDTPDDLLRLEEREGQVR